MAAETNLRLCQSELGRVLSRVPAWPGGRFRRWRTTWRCGRPVETGRTTARSKNSTLYYLRCLRSNLPLLLPDILSAVSNTTTVHQSFCYCFQNFFYFRFHSRIWLHVKSLTRFLVVPYTVLREHFRLLRFHWVRACQVCEKSE